MKLPEGLPEFVITALSDMEQRADVKLRDVKVSPETARGYYMAFREMVDVFETEAALEGAKKKQAMVQALERHQEELLAKLTQ